MLAFSSRRQSQVLQTQVTVISAQANASVTVIVANATSQAKVVTNAALANNQLALMAARGSALGKVSSQLGFATPAELMKYLYTGEMHRKV